MPLRYVRGVAIAFAVQRRRPDEQHYLRCKSF